MTEREGGFRPPIEISKDLVAGLYRLADSKDQVNWAAQMNPELGYGELLLRMYDFLDFNIRLVSNNPDDLRAVIGISGIDSAVSAYLTAETMKRAKLRGSVRETSLTLVSFRSMSEEDEQYGIDCYRQIKLAYPEIPIYFYSADLTGILREVDSITEGIVDVTGYPKSWPAEPSTGIIDVTTVSLSYKNWSVALDSTNKTEEVLGEINIPSGCSLKLLENLWKSEVYGLAQALGISEELLDRRPINSTYGTSKIDSYFGELPDGISPRQVYRMLDLVLKRLYDGKQPVEKVADDLGHSVEFVRRVRRKIDSQDHRRKIPVFTP